MKRYNIDAYCSCEDNYITYEQYKCDDGDWVRYEDANDEIGRLQKEVVNRNQRALDGDKAVLVREGLLDALSDKEVEIERITKEKDAIVATLHELALDWQKLRDALEKVSLLSAWRDKGHFCHSKSELNAAVDIAKDALRGDKQSERKCCLVGCDNPSLKSASDYCADHHKHLRIGGEYE